MNERFPVSHTPISANQDMEQRQRELSHIEEKAQLSGNERIAVDILMSSEKGLTHSQWRELLSQEADIPSSTASNLLRNLRNVFEKREIPLNREPINATTVVYSFEVVNVQEGPRVDTFRVEQLTPSSPNTRELTISEGLLGVANQIQGLMPQEQIGTALGRDITPDQYSQQVFDLAKLVQGVREGGVKLVDPIALMNASNSEKKLGLTIDRLRTGLAEILIKTENRRPQDREESMGYYWGRLVAETLDFMGRDGDLVNIALDHLPEVERTLAVALFSDTMSEQLEYPDIEECGSNRFATYIRHATAAKDQGIRDQRLQLLIETVMERDADESINPADIIENLLRSKHFDLIVDKLRESATYLRFSEALIEFFRTHPKTRHIAWKIQNELDRYISIEDIIPRSRRIE